MYNSVFGKEECLSGYFSDIISKHDDVNIVFSTSWREYSTVDRLKSHFPQKIQHKFIGMTPIITDAVTHTRFREIMMFNNQHQIPDYQWIAIDDMKCLFPPNCPNLILTDAKTGFSKKEEKILTQMLLKTTLKTRLKI